MIARGIESTNATIEACQKTLAGLESADPEWKEVLSSIIKILEGMETNFFLKTNLAIPITNKCRKDAEEIESLMTGGNLSKFPEVLARFQGTIEELLKQGKMEGVIIT